MAWVIVLLGISALAVAAWLLLRRDARPAASMAPSVPQPAPGPSHAPPDGDLLNLTELKLVLSQVADGLEPADEGQRQTVERLGLGNLPDLTSGQARVLLAAHRMAETHIQAETGLRNGYDGERRIEAALVCFIVNDSDLRARALDLTRPKPKRLGRPPAEPADPRDEIVRRKARHLLEART